MTTDDLSPAEAFGYLIIDSLDEETKAKVWALIAERADNHTL